MCELKCALRKRLDLSTDDNRTYWAAFTTAFFGFLRCSEYSAPNLSHFDKDRTLLRSDLTIDSNGYRLHIKASKTDPFRLRVDLFLSRSHYSVCPLKHWKNTWPVPEHWIYRYYHKQMGPSSLLCVLPLCFGLYYTNWASTKTNTQVTASGSEKQRQQLPLACQIR